MIDIDDEEIMMGVLDIPRSEVGGEDRTEMNPPGRTMATSTSSRPRPGFYGKPSQPKGIMSLTPNSNHSRSLEDPHRDKSENNSNRDTSRDMSNEIQELLSYLDGFNFGLPPPPQQQRRQQQQQQLPQGRLSNKQSQSRQQQKSILAQNKCEAANIGYTSRFVFDRMHNDQRDDMSEASKTSSKQSCSDSNYSHNSKHSRRHRNSHAGSQQGQSHRNRPLVESVSINRAIPKRKIKKGSSHHFQHVRVASPAPAPELAPAPPQSTPTPLLKFRPTPVPASVQVQAQAQAQTQAQAQMSSSAPIPVPVPETMENPEQVSVLASSSYKNQISNESEIPSSQSEKFMKKREPQQKEHLRTPPVTKAEIEEEAKLQEEKKDREKFKHLMSKAEKALQQVRAERMLPRPWTKRAREDGCSLTTEEKASNEGLREAVVSCNHSRHESDAASIQPLMSSSSSMEKSNQYEMAAELISDLEQAVKGLQLDLKTAELHHQTVELKLHDVIHYQQEKLQKLEQEKENANNKNILPMATSHKNATSEKNIQDSKQRWATIDESSKKEQSLNNKDQIPATTVDTAFTGSHREDQMLQRSNSNKANSRDDTDHFPIITTSQHGPMLPVASHIYQNGAHPLTTPPASNSGKHRIQPNAVDAIESKENTEIPPIIQPPILQTTLSTDSGDAGSTSQSSRISCRTENGDRIVFFANGTRKEIRKDGTTVTSFPNGDCRTTSVGSGSVAYFHASARVIQVTTPDGSNIFEFPNKQVERHFADGRKIIKFPDGTKQRIYPDGSVETVLPGGKFLLIEHPDGTRDVTPVL